MLVIINEQSSTLLSVMKRIFDLMVALQVTGSV